MSRQYEEDLADKWLRENDEYYTDDTPYKKRGLEYPYETKSQEYDRKRQWKEIPFSEMERRGWHNIHGIIDFDDIEDMG